jgi:hypothetical protein
MPGQGRVHDRARPSVERSSSRGHYESAGRALSSVEMVGYYAELVDWFPVGSIEDGQAGDARDGWRALTGELGDRVQLSPARTSSSPRSSPIQSGVRWAAKDDRPFEIAHEAPELQPHRLWRAPNRRAATAASQPSGAQEQDWAQIRVMARYWSAIGSRCSANP